jgi:hypothetical protein
MGPGILGAPARLASAAPFVFAAVIVQLARRNRLLTIGAVALAVAPLIDLLAQLVDQLLPQLRSVDPLSLPLQFAWLFTLIGALLIAAALGGIRSSLGWAVVVTGLLMMSLGVAQNIMFAGTYLGSGEGDFPLVPVLISIAGQSVLVGWAYLLGAALERRTWLTALGAALTLAWVPALWILPSLAPTSAGSDNPWWLIAILAALELGSWVLLICGALFELPSLSRRRNVEA